jgi:hypothetical protein
VGRDSVVDVATRYVLDGPGIESRWEEGDFPYLFRPALGTTQLPIQWIPGFLEVKRLGLVVDHPYLWPRLKKSRAILLLPLWPFVASSRVKLTFNFTRLQIEIAA